jgi:ElaB/YqjD/DUF883 family membrane-anchored ribosome-binding protein
MTPTPTAAPSPDKILDDFNTVVLETEQLLKSVASLGHDKANVLRGNVDQLLAEAGERLAEIRERSIARATEAAKAADEYVHANPWRAIGLAALVVGVAGLVSGLVIARR